MAIDNVGEGEGLCDQVNGKDERVFIKPSDGMEPGDETSGTKLFVLACRTGDARIGLGVGGVIRAEG